MSWGQLRIKDPRSILSKEEFDQLVAATDREEIALLFELLFISAARIGEVVGNRVRKCKACGFLYHPTRAVLLGKDSRGKNEWDSKYIPKCPKCGSEDYELDRKRGFMMQDVEGTEWWLLSEKKKDNPEESVSLTTELIGKLRAYAQKSGIPDNERLFPFSRSRIHELIKFYLKKAGLLNKNVHVHTLRHTSAKYLCKYAKNPTDIKIVQHQLRHSDPDMTMGYVDLLEEDRQDLLKRAHGEKKEGGTND